MNLKRHVLAVAIGCVVASPLAAVAGEEDYKQSAGYIDFGDLKRFSNGDESIEVFLAPPLLGLIEAIIAKEEPELAAMIEELLLVKVDVFSFDPDDTEQLEGVADRVSADLGGKGWQRLVKVQQRDERVLLYILPTTREDGDRTRQLISGVVVVVLGGEDLNIDIGLDDDGRDAGDATVRRRHGDEANEAVFVNIVGTFDLEAVAELIERFDVPRVRGHLNDWDDEKSTEGTGNDR